MLPKKEMPMRFAMLLCAGVLITLPVMGTEKDKAMFVKHWQMAKEFTLAVADAMPADGYHFKPVTDEMSFGQLMMHIAAQNSDSCATATSTKPLPGLSSETTPPDTDKQTAMRFLTLSFDKCAKAIQAMPADQWDQEVYKFKGQPVTAGETLLYTFTHTAQHRGQAEVYLRVKNIKPPAWRF
jgi:uncharacterized damage-inducible protein DinB